MKFLLAVLLAGSVHAQTKNYNLNVVHLGSVNSASATGTKPFREVASASGVCTLAGEIVSITGSAEIYKCPSNTMTWTLITGSGESITVQAPLSRVGDVISCPTCVTTSVTSLTQLAGVGVLTSGVWQATRVALPYGGTSSDLSATGPGFLKQATLGSVVTVVMPAYSDLTGVPSTFAPSAHASAHQNGGADEVATATPGANAIPKADAANKLAGGWLSEVLTLANLSDVSGKQGNGTLVAMANGAFTPGNAVATDSNGNMIDSGVTPGASNAAFNAITSGTNTAAAMVCGSGCSISASGGSIGATSIVALTGLPNQADGTILANISGGSAPASATTFAALGGKFSIDNLSDARVSRTDNTHIALSAGSAMCGVNRVVISAIASVTLVSGTTGNVSVGVDGEDGCSVIIARGSTLDISGTGFTESTLDDFSTRPRVKLIAVVPVSTSIFGSVTEARTFVNVTAPVAGDGLSETTTVDGLQELLVDTTIARVAQVQSGELLYALSLASFDEEFYPNGSIVNQSIGKYGWIAGGSASGTAWSAPEAKHPGLITLQVNAGADGTSSLYLDTASGVQMMDAATFDYLFSFRTSTSISQAQWAFGFADSTGIAPNNMVGLTFASSSGCAAGNGSDTAWTIRVSNGGTATTSTTNMSTVATATWYKVRMRSAVAGTILFSTCSGDGCTLGTETSIATNVPTAALTPFFFAKTCDGTAKILKLDAIKGSIATAR